MGLSRVIMRKLKLLHIASFEGNIGDNASHLGFKEILRQLSTELEVEFDVSRLEIRKAYANYNGHDKLLFDENFARKANEYDLTIFGGGGFLDYWVHGSSNGTTIDIDNEILELINKPILMTSVGSNPHRKVPEENYNKFEGFLNHVSNSCNVTIALRNDGSVDSLRKDFGDSALIGIKSVVDHGFFFKPDMCSSTLAIDGDYAAINITNDQIEMFNEGRRVSGKAWYYRELVDVVSFLVEERKLKVVLVPHIYSDVLAIAELMDYLPESYLRSKVVIAPSWQGDSATNFIFNIYKNSKLVIASRYHANICSLKFGVQTIGLSPLRRIEYVHNTLSNNKSSIFIEDGFSLIIKKLITTGVSANLEKLEKLKNSTMEFYRNYFSEIIRRKFTK